MIYSFCKLLFLSFVISLCQPVRVNMQGSFSLGQDVMDTLANYVKRNYISSSQSKDYNRAIRRRNLDPNAEFVAPSVTNTISVIIKSETICSNIGFCQNCSDFIDRYLFSLTAVIEKIFEDLIHLEGNDETDTAPKVFIFEGSLKNLLKEVKKLLIKTNDKIHENKDNEVWIGMLKQLNVLYQETATEFVSDRLGGTSKEIEAVKTKLVEKLVVATAYVELDFERKLCLELKICLKRFDCTKSLHSLLELLLKFPSDKLKEFVRALYETLAETQIYSHLTEVTANEFQFILHDMAYAGSINAKNIFSTVNEAVSNRLEVIKTSVDNQTGQDVKLMHIILSDMDYFYIKHKYDPFYDFIMEVEHWSRTGGKLKNSIRKVIKEITTEVISKDPVIVNKMMNEVRIFMDLTVEPGTATV